MLTSTSATLLGECAPGECSLDEARSVIPDIADARAHRPVDHIFGRLGGHQLLDLGQLGRLLAEPPWPCLGLPRACGFEARRTIRYMADAFESILVAWLAFVFLPEKPTRSQGGTDGSNPLSSSGESSANLNSSPRRWKRALHVPKAKDAARARASQLLPEAAHQWRLRKHDGRAEAALLALYGARQLTGKTVLTVTDARRQAALPYRCF